MLFSKAKNKSTTYENYIENIIEKKSKIETM